MPLSMHELIKSELGGCNRNGQEETKARHILKKRIRRLLALMEVTEREEFKDY